MYTPEYIENSLQILNAHKELEESILKLIVARLKKTNLAITESAKYEIETAQQAGILYDEIVNKVSETLDVSKAEIKKIFAEAETEVFNYPDEDIAAAGYDVSEFKTFTPKMRKIYAAAISKTFVDVSNLTKTTASVMQHKFINACDLAHNQIVSGVFSYQTAIANAVRAVAADGVTVIYYDSGAKRSLDSAVRNAVLTGVNQTTGEIAFIQAERFGCDIMEISAHAGARADHARWQGKLVSISGKRGYLSLSDIGYGSVTGFMGANCRHNWWPFFEGISKRNYTDEQLRELENETVTYNGEIIPIAEARNRQRTAERSIKKTKRELLCYNEALKADKNNPDLKSAFNKKSAALKKKEAILSDYCKQTGLKRDRYREQVFSTKTEKGMRSWDKSVAQKAVHGNKELTKYGKIRYNKDGTVIITDDWKNKKHISLPQKYKPNAIIETVEERNGKQCVNRTYYDKNASMIYQIHSSNHENPKQHPYGVNGEHEHKYTWVEGTKHPIRTTTEISQKHRKENKDILWTDKN